MKRVLVTGDTSTANSGFAIYKRNVLNGLLKYGFDVGEVGNGGIICTCHNIEKLDNKNVTIPISAIID